MWPTASPRPQPRTLTFPGPASSRVRARARCREGGLTWRGNVQHCFCQEVGSGIGVPRRPSSRLLVLIGVASPLVLFGLSSNISRDHHPPRTYRESRENRPAKLSATGTHTILRSQVPVAGLWGEPLGESRIGNPSSFTVSAWSPKSSAQLWPAPILDVLEVQSYLVFHNSGPRLEPVRSPGN